MTTVNVVVFSADPPRARLSPGEPALRLDEDFRQIREKVRAALHRDLLRFDVRPAARTDDLIQALNEVHPQVVHFSGHGVEEGLMLTGEGGRAQLVTAGALAQLFGAFRAHVRLVVLNACHAQRTAEEIAAEVGCAVGTRWPISDSAAITFGASFYRALAFGLSVQEAFEQGGAAVALNEPASATCHVLVTGRGVDPAQLFLAVPGEAPAAALSPALREGAPACRVPNAGRLFGRSAEIEQLARRLTAGDGSSAHAVYGLPGAGKTDFVRAVGCASRVVEHFPGGVLYAELGQAADAVELLGRWCDALGVARPERDEPGDYAERIRRRLAGRPALLILDDVWETSVAAAQALSDCRTAGCALLVSSRSPDLADALSGSPARSHRLAVLEDGPACDLLAEHAPDAVRDDPGGAAELAAELGNLPLALKLAGRLAQRDDGPHPCRALLGSWRTRLKEMRGHERRPGIEAPDLSLDAVISLSYDAMPDDATRAAAASLSVLGPAPLDFDRATIAVAWRRAVRWIPGAEPHAAGEHPAVEGWLSSFVSSGLLERDASTKRYRLHQTVHAFLEDRCRAWKMVSD